MPVCGPVAFRPRVGLLHDLLDNPDEHASGWRPGERLY